MGIKTIVISSLVGVGVFTGAIVNYDGSDALNNAKAKIAQQASALNIFKTNETALVGKANSLKSQIETLQADVAAKQAEIDRLMSEGTTDSEYIQQLEADVAAKQAEIDTMLTEFAAVEAQAKADGTALENEILRLQGELNEANTQAADLQATVDSTPTVTSDQAAVDEAIGDEVVPVNPNTPDPVEPTPTKPDGATQINYISAQMPVNMIYNGASPEVQLDKSGDNLVLRNVSEQYTYTYSINGGAYQEVLWGEPGGVIGTIDGMNNTLLTVKGSNGMTYTFWLVKQ